jgi:hypothetical protein
MLCERVLSHASRVTLTSMELTSGERAAMADLQEQWDCYLILWDRGVFRAIRNGTPAATLSALSIPKLRELLRTDRHIWNLARGRHLRLVR